MTVFISFRRLMALAAASFMAGAYFALITVYLFRV
jgi:hypothetical protein